MYNRCCLSLIDNNDVGVDDDDYDDDDNDDNGYLDCEGHLDDL